jgi:hypothetical protein
MLTRGVCRAIPGFFGIVLVEVTTPLAMRPDPPSFSLANTKIVSPLAMRLPPYIVFCAPNLNVSALGSLTAALIANVISARRLPILGIQAKTPIRLLDQRSEEALNPQ